MIKTLTLNLFIFSFIFSKQSNTDFKYPYNVIVVDLPKSAHGISYRLFIRPPLVERATGEAPSSFYFLDAIKNFTPAAAMSYNYEYFNYIPSAYFIGIGYQNEVNNVPSEENRTRDYTPTAFTPPDKNHYLASNPVDYLHSGGADAFLDVIKKEIIPYIEQNYRVHKSDRVLIGKSMSGLAAAHAAITRPNLFNRYLIISPAIWWDDWLYERKDRAIMKAEASANALEYSTPTRVYFAVGDAEERLGLVTDMYVLVNKLKRSKRKNIQFYLDVLANEQHEGVFPAAFMKGIVSLYANEAARKKSATNVTWK